MDDPNENGKAPSEIAKALAVISNVSRGLPASYAPDEDALYFTTLPRDLRVSVKRIQLDGRRFPVASDDVTVVREHGGHHFAGNYRGIADTILGVR